MVKAIPLGSSESGETSSNTSAASKHSRLSISRFRIGQKILFCLLFSTAQFLHYLCCLSRRLVAFPFERENAGGISFRNVPIFVILTRKTLLTLFFVPDNAFRQNGRPDQLIGHITNDYAVPSVNPGIRNRAIDSLHLKTSIKALVHPLYPSLWIGEAKQFFLPFARLTVAAFRLIPVRKAPFCRTPAPETVPQEGGFPSPSL